MNPSRMWCVQKANAPYEAELAAQLASLRPDTKVVFMSGYTDDAIVRHGVLSEGTAFLQKPFTLDVLVRKVREVLEG